MKKIAFSMGVAVLISVLVLAAVKAQDEMESVDNRVFRNPQRTPSIFRHDEHNEAAEIENCSECHHVYEAGQKVEDESSEDQRCADCHESRATGDRPSLLGAFHGNCKGCHLEKAKGPILCGECHVK